MTRQEITLKQSINIGGIALKAGTTILEFVALKKIDCDGLVEFEDLKDFFQSKNVVFKFNLDNAQIDTLSRYYDKYHTDNIAVEVLKEIQEFIISNNHDNI